MAKEDIKQYEFTSEQSRTEAAENGRLGGIASGRVRKQRRTLREICRELLAEEITLANGKKVDRGTLILLKQMQKSVEDKDTAAAKFVADMSGDLTIKLENITDEQTAQAVADEWKTKYDQDGSRSDEKQD